ncbi:MAG: pitrilysin family protein [Polyangiaceae bacterium]
MSRARTFVETSRALPFVSVVVSFRSGSAHDPPGREGLSRITARMLRRGCQGYTKERIEETIDALGGEFGADTLMSGTTVSFEVIRRSLGSIADLVATMLAKPTLDDEELQRLLRESRAELIESRDSDRLLAGRAFRRTLFADHPYGRRAAGTLDTLDKITRADVEAFYKRHYTRQNAVVAVSGDVSEEDAEHLSEQLLAGLPEGAPVPDPAGAPRAPKGRTLVIVDKPERSQVQMIAGGLGTHPRDEDHIPLLVANTVFGGTFTSRLMQEVRVKRGWSYGASSRAGFDRQRDAFAMSAAPAAADAPGCLSLMLELLETWRKDGITEAELDFTKKYIVRSHAFDVDTARKRVHQKLERALYDLPEDYHATFLDKVQKVDVAAANEAVRHRISQDDVVIGVVGTASEVAEPLTKAVSNLGKVQVVPFDLE